MHYLIAWVKWAVQVVQCTASLLEGSGQWNSSNALPHCFGAVGSGTRIMHYLIAWGQRVVELLQCTATRLGGSGLCSSNPKMLKVQITPSTNGKTRILKPRCRNKKRVTTECPVGTRFGTKCALFNLKATICTKVHGTRNTSVGWKKHLEGTNMKKSSPHPPLLKV